MPAPSLDNLKFQFARRGGLPVDYLDIAAAVEAMGLTDKVIRDAYGLPDSFALAREIESCCNQDPESGYSGEERRQKRNEGKLILTSFVRGVLILMPVFLFLLALALGYNSVFGGSDAAEPTVNSFAIALALSLIFSGGFGISLSHKLHMIFSLKSSENITRIAVFYDVLALAAIMIAAGLISFAFPQTFNASVLHVSTFGLGLMWISLFTLFPLRREWLFAPIFLLGVFLTIAAKEVWQLDSVQTQLTGSSVIGVLTFACSFLMLKKRQPRKGADTDVPFKEVWLKSFNSPQFVFGVLYFSLLFADRLANWTATGNFIFRPSYEFSLDLAMFSLLFVTGLLEYRMVKFWREIVNCRRKLEVPVASVIHRFLFRSMAFFLVAASGGFLVSLIFAYTFDAGQKLMVVVLAAPSYAFFAWGSFACNLYMGFRRWKAVIAAGSIALFVDLVVSFSFAYKDMPDLAAIGLFAGSATFFLAGTALILRLARNFAHFRFCSS